MSRVLWIAIGVVITVTAMSLIPGPTSELVERGVDTVSWWRAFLNRNDGLKLSNPIPDVESWNLPRPPVESESQELRFTPTPQSGHPVPKKEPAAFLDQLDVGASVSAPDFELMKLSFLDQINESRREQGLHPVTLDLNPAAQRHAEDLRGFCYLSHWGRDGLKPYMRYALAGGQNANAENVAGFKSCRADRAGLDLNDAVKKTQQDLMDSPGHRETILTPEFRKVSLGISCDERNYCWMVQQFQGDYVHFSESPRLIRRSILSMEGSLKNEVVLAPDSLSTIWYDQLPHELTLGQLDRTCTYRVGQVPLAFVRPPAPAGRFYLDTDEAFFFGRLASDPYHASPQLPRREGNQCEETTPAQTLIPALDATTFELTGTSFKIQADLTQEIARHGPGVYTILIWGVEPDKPAAVPFVIISYPIFVEAPSG